jgi:hypothetical protein
MELIHAGRTGPKPEFPKEVKDALDQGGPRILQELAEYVRPLRNVPAVKGCHIHGGDRSAMAKTPLEFRGHIFRTGGRNHPSNGPQFHVLLESYIRFRRHIRFRFLTTLFGVAVLTP